MPAGTLHTKKTEMTSELNKLIEMKKDASAQFELKNNLLEGSQPVVEMGNDGATLSILSMFVT
jgi:hypothetical protein